MQALLQVLRAEGEFSPRRWPARRKLLGIPVAVVMVFGALAACGRSQAIGEGKPKLQLSSASFPSGGDIPKKFTCDGNDASPQLAWSAPPQGTQSLALIVTDPDAPVGTFVHWVLYDLPAEKRELPEAVPTQEQLPDGSRQGRNDFDKIGYGGPCPPGGTHRYVFTLYAVDRKLNLPAGATRKQVENAVKDHVLAGGDLMGRYHH